MMNDGMCLQGSATLSMAYAGALFADACLRGLNGEPNVVECAYVASSITELPFFASRVKLGPEGELSQNPSTHRIPARKSEVKVPTSRASVYTPPVMVK